jgi:hypothetical protein
MSTSGDIQTGSIEPLSVEAVTTEGVEDSVDNTSFTAYELSLLHILKVPMNLTRSTTARSLSEQFLCYLAVNNAIDEMRMIKKWPEKPPTERQVTELFIGKSQWMNVWRPTFSRVSQHFPEMVKLL